MGAVGFNLIRSRYDSADFNVAIHDGALQVYFAQHQEDIALKVYFKVQEQLNRRDDFRELGSKCIFIMLYSNRESFSMSFGHSGTQLGMERFNGHLVVGINGSLLNDDLAVYDKICYQVMNALMAPALGGVAGSRH